MKPRFCYWTVVDGTYADMAQTVVQSARQVGVTTDFHIWTDQPIRGAISHRAGDFSKWKWGCMFKLLYMYEQLPQLNYDYFVWFDADTYFVRDPGRILRVMHGSPLHIALECDVCLPQNVRREWWLCPNEVFAELMRSKGVRSKAIYNVNGGLFVVHRDAIDSVYQLTHDFFNFCQKRGYTFVDEPLLAYAMQMLCGNPSLHTLRATADLWASDWIGQFGDGLPDGRAWRFIDYFTEEEFDVNPAIVHVMRSKRPLIEAGRKATLSQPV